MSTVTCVAAQGRILLLSSDPALAPSDEDALMRALAGAAAFGVDLGAPGPIRIRLAEERDLPAMADAVQAAFAFPLAVRFGGIDICGAFDRVDARWTVPDGFYWGAFYKVRPAYKAAFGAEFVVVLVAQGALPAHRWNVVPRLGTSAPTPPGAAFPPRLEVPKGVVADPIQQEPVAVSQTVQSNVADRLLAALAELDHPENGSNAAAGDEEEQNPFVGLIDALVAKGELALVQGSSSRRLAERLELDLERDPMVFQRPGEWFFEQDEVDELFASDHELTVAIGLALSPESRGE